jgi:hypothetical protein
MNCGLVNLRLKIAHGLFTVSRAKREEELNIDFVP